MKELIAKLLQIKSKADKFGIDAAQRVVDDEFNEAYVTKVGYDNTYEVQGILTLTQKTEFATDILEGTALVQQNDVMLTMDRDKVVQDNDHNISYKNFQRNYVGTSIINSMSQWESKNENKKTSEAAQGITGQQYEQDYMFNHVTVVAPIQYEAMLKYLEGPTGLDVDAELEEVRVESE